MEELEKLEMELMLLQDNIKRIKSYQSEKCLDKWTPLNSRVVGEFKHRIVALKQRLTLVSNLVTGDLFK